MKEMAIGEVAISFLLLTTRIYAHRMTVRNLFYGEGGFSLKVSELIRILKKNHCKLLRHGNSHDIWISQITGKKFTVP